MDFVKIIERSKRDEIEIFPDFQTGDVEDLLGRGKSFYAVWNEQEGIWSQKENDVQKLVDAEIWDYVEEVKKRQFTGRLNVKTLKSNSSGMWNSFTQYMKRFPDSGINLDNKLTFSDTKVKKSDYVSKRLPYSLSDGPHEAWDQLVDTLYSPSEREKIEWSIGAIVSGDSRKIQKFFVLYGPPGKGKGTILQIIRKLFEGYYISFDAKSLGMSNDQFSMEVFRSNPLVAIDVDGNLSRIEDNTRLNAIVSHEPVVVNEKGKTRYSTIMNCFLYIASNDPVKITNAKSGIIRRLIDINPTGKELKPKEYEKLISQIDFELGSIAKHCLDVYRDLGKNYYKNYVPSQMIEKTDVFYNFVDANIDIFEEQEDGISLKQAYAMYKEYCEEALVEFKLPMYKFREELKNYFDNFDQKARVDGKEVRSWYSGFKKEKLEPPVLKKEEKPLPLVLDCDISLLDELLADCPAQYAKEDGSPCFVWGDVTTVLRDLDTGRVHYVQTQKYDRQLICVDFDIRNSAGEKDMLLNLEAASKWPATYTEFSKSGCGVHLYYIYDGDVSKLSAVFGDGIEIKVFRGRAALRRRVSKCNDIPIAHLAEGTLPLKEEKMIDVYKLKDQDHLINAIKKSLRKGDNVGGTKCEIDLINKNLNEAYNSGMYYDVSDMMDDILQFGMHSTNNKDYCMKVVNQMKFKCKEIEEAEKNRDETEKSVAIGTAEEALKGLVIFDIEMFRPTKKGELDADGKENPGLFLVCWKIYGVGSTQADVYAMVNPKPFEIEEFVKNKLGGFNNLSYDNPMVYYRMLGYNNARLYDFSTRLVGENARDAIPYESKKISFIDIFDMCSVKQSLKKWEVELNKPHMEVDIPWNMPAPESQWDKVIEYCKNDVLATEAVLMTRMGDFKGRLILADVSGGSINDRTNALTGKFVFEGDRHPQSQFNYRNMADMSDVSDIYDDIIRKLDLDPEYTKFDSKGRPIFPGYKYDATKPKRLRSTYRGETVGEGGYVFARPGIWTNIRTQDVSGMHPASIIAEKLFGDYYTQRFADIVQARTYIKHKDFESARAMLGGKLAKYLDDESQAKDLSYALKIATNAVYGQTAASYPNVFRDPRNIDNIVAKRGALFMINLRHEIERRGYTVVHCKTDSIKVANTTDEIIEFIRAYGKLYGYSFETEADYERLCLVNDAVYIAYERNEGWSATGAQFQQPYIFKTLFSGEPTSFEDLRETKSVSSGSAIYLDMNEKLPDVTEAEEEMDRRNYNAEHPEKRKKLLAKFADESDDDVRIDISKGHDYKFIGKVGQFTPIKPGLGGGLLMRESDGKYSSVTGTKGYRWLESELVSQSHREDDVDMKYYEELVSEAVETIEKFGSFERFIDTSRPYEDDRPKPKAIDISSQDSDDEDAPWDDLPPVVPCGDGKYNSCIECPNCVGDVCKAGYSISVNGGSVA